MFNLKGSYIMDRRMITYFLICSLGLLEACASAGDKPPEVKVNGLKAGMDVMSNVEVIQASKDCINYRMRPNVQYVAVATTYGKVMVPLTVNCEPYYALR